MVTKRIKTVEFVSPAHPDKICDQISDLVLDWYLLNDKDSRVAIETMIGHWEIKITGEVTSRASVDYDNIVKKVLTDNRYDPELFTLTVNVVQQSKYIAQWVDTGWAWDQWIMVWYATRETETFMPFEYEEARSILRDLWEIFPKARDMKSQVTTEDGKIKTIVVSAERIKTEQILEYLNNRYKNEEIRFIVNPCGEWEWGPDADAGVTWRKIVVDNYWPQVEVGGGAYSGKDPSKVDRSGAYYSRYLATKILRETPSIQWCKVKIAYSIGISEPVMVSIETDKGEMEYQGEIITPALIKKELDLLHPMYYKTAKWGHYWNGFNWDK